MDVLTLSLSMTAIAGGITAARMLGLVGDRPAPPAIETEWKAVGRQDGTWAVYKREVLPELGVDEDTSYEGYEGWQATAIANWLNDREDFRSMDQVLTDATTAREKAAKAQEMRRLRGGEPVYALGSAKPVAYLDPLPPARYVNDGDLPDITAARKLKHHELVEVAYEKFQHHLTMQQLGLCTKRELLKMLDEVVPVHSHADVWTESALREELMNLVRAISRDGWSVEAHEQYRFLRERAAQLNLKHIFMSYVHTYPTVFDDPHEGIPTKREWR